MDIGRWTIEERMRLPYFCFGARKLLTCRVYLTAANVFGWWITSQALPEQACIWSIGLLITESDHRGNYIRMGLADAVPTSEAEMDATQNIFPDFGNNAFTPPRINTPIFIGQFYNIPVFKGVNTQGKKFVVEGKVNAAGSYMSMIAYILVSALPTNISGWIAENFFLKVR